MFMRKMLAVLMLGWGVAVHAAEGAKSEAPRPKPSMLRTWFKHLKEGLSESSVAGSFQKSRVTAVAAVRGAPQGAVEPDKPQWKGGAKAKKAEQLKKEKAELASAVDLILEGKVKEGEAGLEAFEKAHPKSPLLADVAEAREKLKELEAGAAPAEQTEKAP